MTMLFAATYPERVRALILYDALAKTTRSEDHPYGKTPDQIRQFFDRFVAEMGTGENLDLQGRSGSMDQRFKRWWARFERSVATPTEYRELAAVFRDLDIRAVLPSIQAPTLLLHRIEDPIIPVDQSHHLAKAIPTAKLVELRGVDHLPFLGDADAIVDEIEEFLTGARPAPETDRVLATVLFTDIVGSTELVAAVGDQKWRQLLEAHHRIVRRELERFRGREVDTAGDGFMATFDGPARAIRCASAIAGAVRDVGLEIRSGVHTGECEQIGEKLGGIAVHIAARVAAAASPGEVLVSQTVKDLTAGSGIAFEDRGTHELKGVPDPWRLFAVPS
jgi:class 3 adenylate cyclase